MSISRHAGERRVLTGLRRIRSTRDLLIGWLAASRESATIAVQLLVSCEHLSYLTSARPSIAIITRYNGQVALHPLLTF